MSRYSLLLLIVAVLVSCMCAGCEKFTRARYETVYIGMPQFEVEQTLGEPAAKFSDSWSYLHDDPFYKAIIQFRDERVSDKAWYDANEMGTNPDTKFDSQKGAAPAVNVPKVKVDTVVQ